MSQNSFIRLQSAHTPLILFKVSTLSFRHEIQRLSIDFKVFFGEIQKLGLIYG